MLLTFEHRHGVLEVIKNKKTKIKMITAFRDKHRFLSNFWPARVTLDKKQYPSVEHAYQAAKTKDRRIRRKITRRSAGQAKKIGQRLKPRKDWNDKMRLTVMRRLLQQKFSTRNPELVAELLKTGDSPLIEGNTWGDTFFGVCNGVGHNHLGKMIMEVRTDLLNRITT